MPRRRWPIAFFLLLLASWTWQALVPPRDHPPLPGSFDQPVAEFTGAGRPTGRDIRLRVWGSTPTNDPRPVVLLLHGSPGDGSNFARLAPLLEAEGYRVLAPDLPGFAASTRRVASMSMLAGAHATLDLMDRLHIDRAHVVGWSNGGGVAIHMAQLAPHRLRTMTLLGAIGAQENEGSGNYWVEHAKYALGFVVIGAVPELLPHFGFLGRWRDRTAFLRNFWDSDQRPLRAIMSSLRVPTLVLHGRRDVLVDVRAAIDHWRTIPNARLILLDADHFIPFLDPHPAATVLHRFFTHVDGPVPSTLRLAEAAALARARGPGPGRTMDWLIRERSGGPWILIEHLPTSIKVGPWYAEVALLAVLVALAPTLGVLLAAALTTGMDIDWFVAWLAIALGMALLHARPWLAPITTPHPVDPTDWTHRLTNHPFREGWGWQFVRDRRLWSLLGLRAATLRPPDAGSAFTLARVLAILTWTTTSLLAAILALALVASPLGELLGLPGLALGVLLAIPITRLLPALSSRHGRRHLRQRWARRHHEYWSSWAWYLPLIPWWAWLAARHGGAWAWSAVNPVIGAGGGIVGESKHAIMHALAHDAPPHLRDRILPTVLIPPGDPRERLAALLAHPDVPSFPLILKPDSGWRGHAVKLARTPEDARAYLTTMTAPAIAQPFDPGPEEAGILWVRRHDPAAAPAGEPDGFIFSITTKRFPQVVGDGRRTLEDLLHDHPRHRAQADVFLARFASRTQWIPQDGEIVPLSLSGNHCQGTMFLDGTSGATPALADAIDGLARSLGRGGLDLGRFDVRARSAEELAAGQFRIVELNGVTGESTNMYDPGRSFVWAMGIHIRLWGHIFRLGGRRLRQGVRPLGWSGYRRHSRAHAAQRAGSAVAD